MILYKRYLVNYNYNSNYVTATSHLCHFVYIQSMFHFRCAIKLPSCAAIREALLTKYLLGFKQAS